jgi:dihydrofolate synthase/folylpolyglutamate synthase
MNRHPILEQLASSGVRLGLDNIHAFLTFLGEPHRAYPVVHVAGTNGKGSVCAMVTWVLKEAGYRVGTNLSPHLQAINERILIEGMPIDDASFNDAIEALDRVRHDWAQSMGFKRPPLTYFEFITTVAFTHFAQVGVDVAVMEVGMGGRLDATNVVHPLVSAITHIGIDHSADLGSSLAEIAGEKAGIIKRGVPVVLGPMPSEAREAIERRARILNARLWRPGPELLRERRRSGWQFTTPGGSLRDVQLGLAGEHQGANALVALGILHQLRAQGFHIPDEAILRGFANVQLGGRLEEVLPGLIVDGAHNEDGTRAVATWLKARPRPKSRILLFGMGQGRDPVRAIAPLLPLVDEVVTTRCAHPKARDSVELAMALEGVDALLAEGGRIEEALPEVYREAHETLVVGSLFLAGAVKSIVASGALRGITPGQGPTSDDPPAG